MESCRPRTDAARSAMNPNENPSTSVRPSFAVGKNVPLKLVCAWGGAVWAAGAASAASGAAPSPRATATSSGAPG